MTDMMFTIEFYGPFRVATGHADAGSDIGVDLAQVLPASSLKGVMRAAALDTLGLPNASVDRVFGSSLAPSPWSWSDGDPVDDPIVKARSRIQIGPSGTAVKGALVRSQELWLGSATFSISLRDPVMSVVDDQEVLTASALSVKSLGADRNRGFGWVGITQSPPILQDLLGLATRISEQQTP